MQHHFLHCLSGITTILGLAESSITAKSKEVINNVGFETLHTERN